MREDGPFVEGRSGEAAKDLDDELMRLKSVTETMRSMNARLDAAEWNEALDPQEAAARGMRAEGQMMKAQARASISSLFQAAALGRQYAGGRLREFGQACLSEFRRRRGAGR